MKRSLGRPPNLLLFITDQQQADTVAPQSPCQTPNLQRLADTGIRFQRCYAPNPICSPSRASLFTGLLPHSHGMVDVTHAVPSYRARLEPDLLFWPQVLQRAGYRTAYFGKWHVERSNRLQNFGFDEYEVAQYHQLAGLVERAGPMSLRRVVQQKGYRDFLLYGVVDDAVESTPEYHLYSDGIVFVREAAQNPSRPWLLVLSSEAPHDPYVALRPYFERYNPADIPLPASFGDDLADRPVIYRRIQRVWETLTPEDFVLAITCYYANISLIDEQIGRLLAVLDETGQSENTLILFVSDHGDYMGAHGLFLKGIPAFEEAYRVPLILAGPGIPASREQSHIVSSLDLASTLIALTIGEEFPCQGRSLLPLLVGDEAGWQDEAFAECHGQRFNYTQRVLWQDHLKYVFNGFDEDELYDLAADPHELHNLAADPVYRSQLEAMAARMWQIMWESNDSTMTQAQYGMFRFAPVGPEAGKPTDLGQRHE